MLNTEHQISELIGMYKGLSSIYDTTQKTRSSGISDYITEKNILKALSGLSIKYVLVTDTVHIKWARIIEDMGFEITCLTPGTDKSEPINSVVQKNGSHIKRLNKSIDDLIYDNYSFDLIFADGGLFSITDDLKGLLEKFKRLTRQGGYIWFDYLNLMGWSMIQPDVEAKVQLANKEEESIYMGKNEFPFRFFLPRKIRYMLYDSGFLELNEFGNGILTNPMMNDEKINSPEIQKLCKTELELSRNYNLTGSAFRVQVLAQKIIH